LTKQLHDDFKVEYREEGIETRRHFFNLKGSCRDLSWMQINLLRQLGIAARFVTIILIWMSQHELHAWVDVLYRESVG
jgi:transglutaminase-like putative cysteine protease